MRLHPSPRTLGLTASLLTIAILVPAGALGAGPRDGTCDPLGSGSDGPLVTTPGPGAGDGPQAQANGNGDRGNVNLDRDAAGAGKQATRRGPGQGLRQPSSGVLTEEQKLDLAAMAEEEKLAHDVYTQLGAVLGAPELERIAASEANHLAAIRNLLVKYGIKDPTAGKDVGIFATRAFQDLYDQFYAQGSTSLDAAYAVGVAIEQDDLARLADAKDGVTAQNVLRVYANLLAASRRHLAAFSAM
jgi:hypothetical protein